MKACEIERHARALISGVILLAGGDKRTQDRDIKTAIKLARGV
jgi:putative component of toxin-antitoxin plasmid stabilization module